jgi:hypothetical protein
MAKSRNTSTSQAERETAEDIHEQAGLPEAGTEATDSLDPAARVQKSIEAFKHFAPSQFTKRERDARTYLAQGENLYTAIDRVVKHGVEQMKSGEDRHSLKLRLTDGVREQMHLGEGDPVDLTVTLAQILGLLNLKLPGTPSLLDDAALTKCAAEKVAQKHLDEIEENTKEDDKNTDKTDPVTTKTVEGKKSVDASCTKDQGATDGNSQDGTDGNSGVDETAVMDFISERVNALMEHMPSPETQPVLVPPDEAELARAKDAIAKFELNSGPSDVTSYHDFNTLRIAFEHVWAEVFDQRLHRLGREIYETYIGVLAEMGLPPDVKASVSSKDDIKSLMSDARDLGRIAADTGSATSQGGGTSQGGTSQSDVFEGVKRVAGAFTAVRDSVVAALNNNNWTATVDNTLKTLKSDIDAAKNATSQSAAQQQLQQIGTTFVTARTALATAVGGNWSTLTDTLLAPLDLEIQWAKAGIQPSGELQHITDMCGAVRECLVAVLTNNWAAVVDSNLLTLKTNIDIIRTGTPQSVTKQQFQQLAATMTAARTALTGAVGPNWSTIVGTLLVPLTLQIQWAEDAAVTPGDQETNKDAHDLGGTLTATTRLGKLLDDMDTLLAQKYSFAVFQENSSNFGIMVTYRQTWTPEHYQVGDLVSTIPLAPREARRYTTKQVTKKSRVSKEVEDNLQSKKFGSDTTARVDREIVARAEQQTNFKVTADGSFGTEANKIHATGEAGGNDDKFSLDSKKNLHDAVLKSAQEYKHDTRTEIETTSSEETETTTYHEIQNPNDELTVTYLFYELQRTYRVTEQIHQVTPVVLVANNVPRPDEIDDAWLIQHDWILRRVLLDDSFRAGLDYLTTSFVGDELNLQILDNNAQAQRQVVEAIKSQVASQLAVVELAQNDLTSKIDTQGKLQLAEGMLGTVKKVFDPLGFTGQTVTGTAQGMQTIADYAQETLDQAEREKLRLLDQLSAASSALQVAVNKLAAATTEHYNKVAEVDRLRVHVKDNILYYMQAIWNHEPPDQRYFRVFQIEVPIVTPKSTTMPVTLIRRTGGIDSIFDDAEIVDVPLQFDDFEIVWTPLVEVADLDNVLGYKGNYAIYALNQNNFLTYHMMQNYLDVADDIKIRDPDDLANYTVSDLQKFARGLYECDTTKDKGIYNSHKEEIRKMIIARLMSGRPEDDRVIVPTDSLFIEALVGTHPLLEEFKLLHRALDVKKVQSDVRHAELENVRLAARVLKGKDEDPDIDKQILIAADTKGLVIQADGN